MIADNVGDNVGDVAGMGADLFESYVGALVSALTLGVAVVGTFNGAGALVPLILLPPVSWLPSSAASLSGAMRIPTPIRL